MSFPKLEEKVVGEFNYNDFLNTIFKSEPQEPFSLRLEMMDTITPDERLRMLADFVMAGAKVLFNKSLHLLDENEVFKLRQYLLSIGEDVDYHNEPKKKVVTDYKPDGTSFQREININDWKIQFKKADPTLNRFSQPDKLI